jgi:hypothetical protein
MPKSQRVFGVSATHMERFSGILSLKQTWKLFFFHTLLKDFHFSKKRNALGVLRCLVKKWRKTTFVSSEKLFPFKRPDDNVAG